MTAKKINPMVKIQQELKAHKGQYNSFGKYNYRSCEDIVEALKPILNEANGHLQLTDKMVMLGDRFYVEATARIFVDGVAVGETTAYAREPELKKGMDASQITGTSSSYARKYALNGLLAIDDTKDADTDEAKKQEEKPVEYISKDQVQEIDLLIDEVEADRPVFLNYFGIDKLENMPLDIFPKAKKALEGKR